MPPKTDTQTSAYNALTPAQQNWCIRMVAQMGLTWDQALADVATACPIPSTINVLAGTAGTIVLALPSGATQQIQISDQSTTPPTAYSFAVNSAFLAAVAAAIAAGA